MYLSHLRIFANTGEPIREVSFHKGLNIILGERCPNSGSTNSIGKTTLLRSIDFCLGGDEKIFYQDQENKEQIDQNVFNFLYYLEPTFHLELKNDLDSKAAYKVIFSKKISGVTTKTSNKLKISHFINEQEISSDEYNLRLKMELFKYENLKPTFRQLISKFIRKDDQQINFILRFLHQAISDLDYEAIHFFLFGYPNPLEIEEKYKLERQIKQSKADIKLLDRLKPAGLEQVILLTQNELDDLILKRDSFKISEKYNIEEDKLNLLQNEIRNLDEQISFLDFELKTLHDRKFLLSEKEFNDNTDAISMIYNEAELYNVTLKKKFEETVKFHNTMLKNELNYVNERIVEIIKQKEVLEAKRVQASNEYSAVLAKLAQYGSLAEYTKLNDQINDLNSKLSNILALNQKSIELNQKLSQLKDCLNDLNKKIDKNIHTIQDNIAIFNKYFSEYCKYLFNQTYYLSADLNDKGIHKFKINSLSQNLGSGKKLSLVVAFDLAYTAFIQDTSVNIQYPKFSTQDKVEIIDIQELYKLAELAKESNGQLLFPIINDKFMGLNDFEKSIILRISKKEKFFRIEHFLPSNYSD